MRLRADVTCRASVASGRPEAVFGDGRLCGRLRNMTRQLNVQQQNALTTHEILRAVGLFPKGALEPACATDVAR